MPGSAGSGGHGSAGAEPKAGAVPVEVAAVSRRSVSAYLETNGVLEAENEVDLVARTSGPIVELAAEEGMRLKKGQLLARIDDEPHRADVELSTVALREAQRAYERAQEAWEAKIISQADYDQALAAMESAEARLTSSRILLSYTRIVAPFDAVVIERVVKLAENITSNQRLFRVSDFDPLLCPIQVPEKELSRLKLGQPAHLEVEAWSGERFTAKVLRLSPVVDAASGTIKVTLEVDTLGKLSPGMFASVFLETDTHDNALAIPKAALSLDSLGDTVYVADGELAGRREVTLGYEEAEFVEVLSGLNESDRVVVVGQDGLSDGTPINVLAGPGAAAKRPDPPVQAANGRSGAEAPPHAPGAGPREGRELGPRGPLSPEDLERMKQRMRERGLTEEQIEERLRRRREQQ
jgi:membrane fusion protein (multidrug efflux system)